MTISDKSKIKFLDTIQNVFLAKSTLNFIGYMLKEAIICSIVGRVIQAMGNDASENNFKKLFVPALCAYFILVFVAVLAREIIARKQGSLTMDPERQKTLTAVDKGLNLIPAWGFKELIAACIGGQPWWTAFIVLVAAAGLAILIDTQTEKCEEDVGTPWHILHSLRKTMAGCMPLGVGFAMNMIPIKLCADFDFNCKTGLITFIYAVVITLLMVSMQIGLTYLTPESPFLKNLIRFTGLSGNFISAWGWDGFLDTARREIITLGLSTCMLKFVFNFSWATMVLIVAASVVVAVNYRSDLSVDETHFQAGLRKLMTIVCASVVAWAFLDYFVGLYRCSTWGCVDGSCNHPLLSVWTFVIAVVLLGVLLMERGSAFLEEQKKAIQ